jgi:hypothetical protein
MSTVAGYTICFLANSGARQMTFASTDEEMIASYLHEKFGRIEILTRTMLDKRTLMALGLAPGGRLEWLPKRRP